MRWTYHDLSVGHDLSPSSDGGVETGPDMLPMPVYKVQTATYTVSQLVSLAANAVLGSLFPAVLIAILYDLKLRKQGGDLMGRVDALARQ